MKLVELQDNQFVVTVHQQSKACVCGNIHPSSMHMELSNPHGEESEDLYQSLITHIDIIFNAATAATPPHPPVSPN